MRRVAADIARNVAEWVYPTTCLVCDSTTGEIDTFRHGVCSNCHAAMTTDPFSVCPWCAQSIGAHTDTSQGCPECRDLSLGFESAVRLGPYGGKLRDAVLRTKVLAGEGLADRLGEILAECRGPALLGADVDLIAPIPLHWWRKCMRGYNQAEAIASELAANLSVPFAPKLLQRIRWTSQHAQPTREARRENVRGAFRVRKGARLAKRTVLLVDDVMTTGSTLSEASRTLREAGAGRVVVAILARR